MARERLWVYVGSGAWSGETGTIQIWELATATGALTLKHELAAGGVAAFMARSRDGKRLYVADETLGFLSSYAVSEGGGALSLTSRVRCAGHPVYLALDESEQSLATCFFQEAKTEIFALEGDGTIGASSCLVESGKESHATVFDPSSRFLFVPTRGDHWIAQYRFDARARQLTPNEPAHLGVEPGVGPRHLAFHPSGRFAYLVNELASTLSVLAFDRDRGTLTPLQSGIPALPGATSEAAGADIHVHPNGRFAYYSNRCGDQSNIAIFALDPESGRATPLGREPTRGRTPRNFALDPEGRFLIAGNQDSASIALFAIGAEGGALEYRGSQAVAPGPFFIGIY